MSDYPTTEEERAPKRFRVELVAVEDGDRIPPAIRLRAFLKAALRSYGLRCVAVAEIDEEIQRERP